MPHAADTCELLEVHGWTAQEGYSEVSCQRCMRKEITRECLAIRYVVFSSTRLVSDCKPRVPVTVELSETD